MKIDPDDLPPPNEPYRGILPFRLLDWQIFLERDVEAERLGNLVSMYSGVLLYGQSGAGKSSLINAGLIPHALRQGRAPERIRVFPQRGRELLVERIQLQEGEEKVGSKNKLPSYLPSRFTSSDDDERVALSSEKFLETLHVPSDLGVPLLIFDQFEELVTLFEESPKDKERFKDALEARVAIDRMLCELLLNDPMPFKIVFAFRDDYLARLGPLFSRIPNLMDQGVRLALPPVELLKQIVRGPFVRSEDGERGLPGHFVDELSEELADKITVGIRASKPSGLVNLSEVQTLCLALWRQPKRREELLRADNPAAVLREIIESTAVDALKKLLPWDRVRARAVLANLVTQEGTRDVVSEENLISETRRNPLMWVFPRDWRKLLSELPEKTGLLRRSFSSGTTYYELASEFLISWIQKRQRAFRRLALVVSGSISLGLFAIVIGLVVLAFRLQNEKANVLREKNKAEAAEKIAVEQERTARRGALRVRKQNLDDKLTIKGMAERLVELTTSEEAKLWQVLQGGALTHLRKHQEAIQTYEGVLEQEPQNAQLCFSLGYLYLLVGKPDKALERTDVALRLNPRKWPGYQNRAVALAGLGRYGEAEAALGNAIEMFHDSGEELFESEVSPEIQQATGVTVIAADASAIHAASLAERANLKAFAGTEAFEQKLKETVTDAHPVETYLTAVNWCYLHMKFRPQDYGGLAAQGAWWEQAGFKPWAKEAFEQFQSKHKQKRDLRYTKLAEWVGSRLRDLKDEKLPEKRLDSQTLAFDAWDHENRNEWDEAQRCIDRVRQMDPDNVQFAVARAAFAVRRAVQEDSAAAEKHYRASKSDCDAILKIEPTNASAYAIRAVAKQRLHAAKAEIEHDLRKAVEYEPFDTNSMWTLSNLINQEQPDEALRLLEQALKVNNDYSSLPWIHAEIAKIHQAQGRLPEAVQSIDSAIALKSNNASWYETRAEMERKLGKPEPEVSRRLAAGYRQVGDAQAKRGKTSDAFETYWSSLETLLANKDSKTTTPMQEISGLLTQISAVIERLGSREKAAEFWRVVNESDRLPDLKRSVTLELERLAKDPRPTPQL